MENRLASCEQALSEKESKLGSCNRGTNSSQVNRKSVLFRFDAQCPCLKHCTPLFDVTVLHEKGEQLAVTQTALADSRMRVLTVEDKLKVRELIDT